MKTTTLFIAIALILLCPPASASTVSLLAPPTIAPGEQFEVQIIGDFESFGLLAGGVQVFFDPALVSVDEFSFAVPVAPDFSCPGSPTCPSVPAGTFGIAFGGDFIGPLLIEPDAGPTLMGTLTMTAAQPIANNTSLVLDLVGWDKVTGGWFTTGVVPIPNPDFFGTTTHVVPLPAAAWLMISAISVLAGMCRHR